MRHDYCVKGRIRIGSRRLLELNAVQRLDPLVARAQRGFKPSTAGVHAVALIAFIGLRAASLGQLALALFSSSALGSINPQLSVTAAIIFAVESLVVTVVVWRKRSPASQTAGIVDTATVSVLHLAQVWFSSPAHRTLTWEAWVFGVSMSSVVLIACLPSWRVALWATAAVASSYLVAVLPAAVAYGATGTALANGAGYLSNVVVGRFGWLYLLRLGASADRAADLATTRHESVVRRAQDVAHNLHEQTATAIRLLAQLNERAPEAVDGSEELLQALQATTIRARRVLANMTYAEFEPAVTLAEALRRTLEHCPYLHVTPNVYGVETLVMPPETLRAIARAVETLLHNVERHSGQSQAVLFADTDQDLFEVSVRDNGAGFDPGSAARGYGLTTVAGRALSQLGMNVDIQTAPGEGTTVTILGRVPSEG